MVMTALRWDAGAMALASPKLRAAPWRNELERMRVRDTEEEGYMYMFECHIRCTDIRKCVLF